MHASVGGQSVYRQFDWSETIPSHAVIRGISALEGVEATDLHEKLGTTLSEHIDPDALNSLVSAETETTILFTYGEYSIRIDGNTLCVSD